MSLLDEIDERLVVILGDLETLSYTYPGTCTYSILAALIQFSTYWFSCLPSPCSVRSFRARITSSAVYPQCQVQLKCVFN